MSMSAASSAATAAVNARFDESLNAGGSDELGKEDFLLLLVTQFQYQDPLNPMEDKEFIAQLSQFSSLEQLMNLNASMGGLTEATREQQMLGATSFIGKTVTASGTSISKEEGKEPTAYQYGVAANVAEGEINIYDSGKNLVYSEAMGRKQAGVYTFEWSGKNNFGAELPDGIYHVYAAARDSDGGYIEMAHQVEGVVSTVISENDILFLRFTDGRDVALSEVRQVSELKDAIDDGEDGGENTNPDDSTSDGISKALDDLNTTLKETRAWADKAVKDGKLSSPESKAALEEAYSKSKKEIRAWADKAIEDGTHTIAEVRKIVEQRYKELINQYNIT